MVEKDTLWNGFKANLFVDTHYSPSHILPGETKQEALDRQRQMNERERVLVAATRDQQTPH